MTKSELIKSLAKWPDDTVIEVSVGHEASMSNDGIGEGRFWVELIDVEDFSDLNNVEDSHCLLTAGRITME